MKLLICGECCDRLTTVAQRLNRMRSDQMRAELFSHTETPPAEIEIPSVVDHDQPVLTPAPQLR
jgi:hypothetical protein